MGLTGVEQGERGDRHVRPKLGPSLGRESGESDTHFAASAAIIARRARGRWIANSVNSPTRLSTTIVPPCCWVTMSQLIDRPSPVPSPVGLVVKNGWNSLSR